MTRRRGPTSFLRSIVTLSTTALLASFAAFACGDDAADEDGTGGSAGTGGGSGGSGGTFVGAGSGGIGQAGAASDLADPCRGGIELPEGEYHVAPGLCVRAVALFQGELRQISFTSNGDLIGVTVQGAIKRYRDVNDDGGFSGADEIVEIANTGYENGNNAHVDEAGGYLYAGSEPGVVRFPYSDTADDLGPPEDVVTGQPSTGSHPYHTVHVYDGWLYVHSGSEENAVAPASPEYDANRSLLKRFSLSNFEPGSPFDWADGEVVAIGLRNMVGFTRNAAGRMYGVVNGLDNLMYGGEDVHLGNPGDDLVSLEPGSQHGYPYCFTSVDLSRGGALVPAGTKLASATDPTEPDPDFTNPHDDAWCADNADPPVTFLPAHTAPLDITFFDGPGGNLPSEWRGGAFVALHGSWNTSPSVGHQVVFIPFDADGNAPMPEETAAGTRFPFTVVFGGGNAEDPADGIWGWSPGAVGLGEDPVRPVGVAISPVDGALYVSSDNGDIATTEAPGQGALYRIGLAR